MHPLLPLLAACTASAGPDLPGSAVPEGFWDHWGDGQAELAGYSLTQPRYGAQREGTAVLVFVTETFTQAQRVKSDGGHPDEFPVLKLNEVRDFTTGIYDYNILTSSFVRLDGQLPLGVPTKVSMSMQEWCGHVYDQTLAIDGGLRHEGHSYFDGEGDHETVLPRPGDGVQADALPILVRGLAGPLVAPGEERRIQLLPSLMQARLTHRAPTWTPATVSRSAGAEAVEVPAGTFQAHTVTVVPDGRPATTWWVEDAAPHRIVRWERTDGEVGELRGTVRTAYWQLNGPGGEAWRSKIGL